MARPADSAAFQSAAELRLRRAAPGDLDALTELSMRSKQSNGYDDAFMAQCAAELKVRESWLADDFWIAETGGGDPCGCIRLSARAADGRGEVETCFVDPAWQGRGVGRLLFDALLDRARSLALSRLGLDADPFAAPFYQRIGFVTIGEAPSGSIPGRMLPRMEMSLAFPVNPGDQT